MSHKVELTLSDAQVQRLQRVTGSRSASEAVRAAVSRAMAPAVQPAKRARLVRGAKRFTSARAAMAYLEREVGI